MSTVRIQLRRGTAAEWTSADTVLSAGELGFETDTGKFKIGNGSTAWTSLTYASILPSDLSELSQDAVNSAIVAGTGLDKTYDDVSNTITLDIDSTVATKTYADSAVSTHSSDTTSVHGISNTANLAYQSDISSHSSDTTDIHGIADTANLALLNGNNDFLGANVLTGTVEIHGDTTLYGPNIIASPALTGNATANNLTVHGNLTVQGTTTTVNAANLSISDNMIYLNEAVSYTVTDATGNGTNVEFTIGSHPLEAGNFAKVSGITPSSLNIAEYSEIVSVTSDSITLANTSTDTYVSGGTLQAKFAVNTDLGFVGAYGDGTYAHAGIVRDATDGVFKFFDGYTQEPGQNITFADATFSDIAVANVSATSATIGDVSNTEIGYLNGVTSSIQTQFSDAATALSNHASDTTSIHGISDTANLVYQTDLSAHASDTTSVHGISDTANLVYQTDLSSHASDTISVHGISDTANLVYQTDLSSHALDTTSIHGISDTANLVYQVDLSSHASDTTSIHGISDTANLVYQVDLSSHASDTTLVHGIADTSALATKTYADDAVLTHASDTTLVHGIADTSALATKTYADDAVSTHNSDTTLVHGIADTSALATKTYADDAVSTHNSDTTSVHGISNTADLATKTYADDAVSTHNSDTTSVHGISNTADLVYQSNLSTHTNATTSVHGIADVAALATKTYADGAVSTHAADTTTHGVTGTIVGTTDTQTLTGKTIALGSNTISGTLAEFNTALSGADFATIAGTETLTGKTISYVDNTITINTANISDITATATELNYVDGVTSAIQTQLDSKLPKSGGTMTGDLILNADPTQALGAATKQYVDTLAAQGLRVKDGVDVATNATLASISGGTITYNNGTSGVGATLTTTGSFATIDGLGLSGFTEPIRVLVKNEATAANNGIYILANSSATVMTRDVWFDSDEDIDAGDFVFVVGGNQGGTGWVQTATVNTVGTDNVTFVQFSGAGTIVAGTNISVSGMTVSAVSNPTFSGLITASSGIAFSDGTQTKIGVPSITTISAKTDSYTLSSLTERDTIIEINKATATTLTVPPDGTVNYPVGTTLDIIQTGAGQVTIAAGSGVTVNATPGLKLRTQWSSCTLLKRAANTWLVYGDLSA